MLLLEPLSEEQYSPCLGSKASGGGEFPTLNMLEERSTGPNPPTDVGQNFFTVMSARIPWRFAVTM